MASVALLATGLLSPRIGNPYSAASPLGLTAILDEAQPGDRIFMVSRQDGQFVDAQRFKFLHGGRRKGAHLVGHIEQSHRRLIPVDHQRRYAA